MSMSYDTSHSSMGFENDSLCRMNQREPGSLRAITASDESRKQPSNRMHFRSVDRPRKRYRMTNSTSDSISHRSSTSSSLSNSRMSRFDGSKVSKSPGTRLSSTRMPGSFHDSPKPDSGDPKAPVPSAPDPVHVPSDVAQRSKINPYSNDIPQVKPLRTSPGGKRASPPTFQLKMPERNNEVASEPAIPKKPVLPLGEIARGLRGTELSATQTLELPAKDIRCDSQEGSPAQRDDKKSKDRQLKAEPAGEENTSALHSEITRLEKLVKEALQVANQAVSLHESKNFPSMLDSAQKTLGNTPAQEGYDSASDTPPVKAAAGFQSISDSSSSEEDYSAICKRYSSDSEDANLPLPPSAHDPIAIDWAFRKPRAKAVQAANADSISARPVQSGASGNDGASAPIGRRSPNGAPDSEDPSPTESPGRGTILQADQNGNPKLQNWGRDKYDDRDYMTYNALKRRHHVTLRDNHHFSLHHHIRQPIARNWATPRKRFTAYVACMNTSLIGLVVGIYAGEVPAIQYSLTDVHHWAILGNVCLFLGMAMTTFLFWPLPLLHGRKPYLLTALAIALPLQFPQAIIVMSRRDPSVPGWRTGLLVSRALTGIALGFAHINFLPTLLDLFGASLQSTHPHGELVIIDDVRRHGGGMGLWLGIWSFSYISSLSVGFFIGAEIISCLNVEWGFYIGLIIIAVTLVANLFTPETRRSPHRRTMLEVETPKSGLTRRVARGEIRMHVQGSGPKWWYEECASGMYLSMKMLDQPGFGLMALYLGWVYGQVVLIIVLLGNLLSAGYGWRPKYVGVGVLSLALGALLAIPNTKGNIFSKSRTRAFRTDSMTFQPRLTWTSHMVRRAAFMIILPLAGLAYTLASAGKSIHWSAPIFLTAIIGYVSNLAIAECNGLIMETFDTSDLQPGVNSKHRLQSLPTSTRRRRTTYSSYPRVSAGFFVSQTLGFLFAAAATGVGGAVTRKVGAQKATAITAGILLGLTILLTISLWRFKSVQVIPNSLFGSINDKRDSIASVQSASSDTTWRAVIIGNPSGKMRRMSLLELGGLSRWTEIRRLNRLLNRSTTQPLNPGWR